MDTGWAMSQQNVEVVLKADAAFSRGDLEGLLAECEPDASYRAAITQEIEVDAGDFLGHTETGAGGLTCMTFTTGPHRGGRGPRSRRAGRRVYVIQGRAKGRGLVFDDGQTLAQVVTLRHGKIMEIRDYSERAEALEAAGLRE